MEYITFSNGVKMPKLGYGVYQVSPDECERCVADAIKVGYRHIDTAQAYANEEGVGNAIKKSGIPRSEFFITTKIWISNYGYEKAKKSLDESMKKLQTDYIDLVLLHQKFGDYYGAWRALEEYYKAGKVKVIGISNFTPDRFVDICNAVEIKPFINQVEMHAFRQEKMEREWMKKYNIVAESWAPFAEGKNNFFTNPVLQEIGKKYNKSVAQVMLRFFLDNDIVCIPKSTHKERMAENLNVFDFHLSEDDKKKVESLNKEEKLFFHLEDPKDVEAICSFSI